MQIGYINGNSKHVSLWHYFSDQKITRINAEDFKKIEQYDLQKRAAFQKLLASQKRLGYLLTWLKFHSRKLFQVLSFTLPGAIFMFRFFEWWNNSEHSKKGDTLAIPPPPPHIKV
jgi:uncharacterized protein (DUF2235 family)